MEHEKPQESIIRETKRIAIGTLILLAVMLIVYAVIGRFSLAVLLGGLVGSAYATFNFFMLGMTVQKAASAKDEEMARMRMRSSYSMRMIGMVVVAVICFAVPLIEGLPCLIALAFPRVVIFALQITGKIKD